MRKIGRVLLFIAFIFLFAGCTNDKQAFTVLEDKILTLESEKSLLTNEVIELKKENSNQKEEIGNLKIELDEIKNGAQNLLIEIKNSFEAEKYEEVLSLSERLHSRFNGTEEDKVSQEIAKLSQEKIDEINRIKKEGEDRLAEEALKSERDKAREIIRISRVYTGSPNSAGGVDLHVEWTNKSEKTVKYFTFTVVPYNAVGDIVRCQIRRNSSFSGRVTGPVKPGQSYGYSNYWDCAWYNNTIKKALLEEVTIEYMDGEEITLKGEDIKHIQY